MPLNLHLRELLSIPIEVDSIRIETLRSQTLDEIKATLVQYGNRQQPLNDFFEVSGSAADGQVTWVGDCQKVKLIGAKMTSGCMRVEGNAGMHLGAEMSGGEIVVTGNVADWAGAEMHGGRIMVHGDAGHYLGAVYRGGFKGMTGGEILVRGDAGNEIGAGMRRGFIAIGGRAGDFPGASMIAGTIFIFGEPGSRPAASMKRGTVAFFDGEHPPEVLLSFKSAGEVESGWLRIYLRHLRSLGFPVPAGCEDAVYQSFSGDHLELGKGEVLVRSL
jgi:formylmethanofuran dehydrogenase subunit C